MIGSRRCSVCRQLIAGASHVCKEENIIATECSKFATWMNNYLEAAVEKYKETLAWKFEKYYEQTRRNYGT